MNLKLPILGALLALAVTVFAACGDAATPTPVPTATPVPQINQVSFTAVDYGFSGPESIPAGMTTFNLANEGQELHHLQLISLPEGMTPLDLLAAFEEAGPEAPPPPGVEAAGGVGVLGPGVSGSSTMNLKEGNYVLLCFVEDPQGVPHLALGMAAPLTVTAATGPLAAEPAATVAIDLFDFGFDLSGPIPAGTQTFEVTNLGPQDHEAILVRLEPGATAQDFLAAFEPDAPPGPPPGLPLGGFQAVANGGRGFFTADFTPGNYALLCGIPDEATGAPHFALGMLEEFTVQ